MSCDSTRSDTGLTPRRQAMLDASESPIKPMQRLSPPRRMPPSPYTSQEQPAPSMPSVADSIAQIAAKSQLPEPKVAALADLKRAASSSPATLAASADRAKRMNAMLEDTTAELEQAKVDQINVEWAERAAHNDNYIEVQQRVVAVAADFEKRKAAASTSHEKDELARACSAAITEDMKFLATHRARHEQYEADKFEAVKLAQKKEYEEGSSGGKEWTEEEARAWQDKEQKLQRNAAWLNEQQAKADQWSHWKGTAKKQEAESGEVPMETDGWQQSNWSNYNWGGTQKGKKGGGKGAKGKLQEKLARIDAYQQSSDATNPADRKQMWSAWCKDVYKIEEAVSCTTLGGGPQRQIWSENEVAQIEATVNEGTALGRTLLNMRETLAEVRHQSGYQAIASEKSQTAAMNAQVRIHGFSFGAPATNYRWALVQQLVLDCGLETRDVKDVQAEDKFGNLHKSCLVEFRNGARAQAFIGAMFAWYPQGKEVFDPIELDAAADHEARAQIEGWNLWVTKVQPEETDLGEKLFKAALSSVFEWTAQSSVEKVWADNVIAEDGIPIAVLDFEEVPGRVLVKVEASWETTFSCELMENFFFKAAPRREIALMNRANADLENAGDNTPYVEILNRFAASLPWLVTIVKYTELGPEPLQSLRRKTEEDNVVAASEGAKGKANGKSEEDEDDQEDKGAAGPGKNGGKGKGKNKSKGKGQGKRKGKKDNSWIKQGADSESQASGTHDGAAK